MYCVLSLLGFMRLSGKEFRRDTRESARFVNHCLLRPSFRTSLKTVIQKIEQVYKTFFNPIDIIHSKTIRPEDQMLLTDTQME